MAQHLSMDELIEVHDDDLSMDAARGIGINWEPTPLQLRRDWMETLSAVDMLRRDSTADPRTPRRGPIPPRGLRWRHGCHARNITTASTFCSRTGSTDQCG